jgi:siroheme synthase-like protein
MRTHPVLLCLEGRRCLVVGGDALAEAKALACLDAGATVTVVAPELTPRLAELAAAGRLTHMARPYRTGDLAATFLAYASTADPAFVERLRTDAARERVLLNVVDRPEACTFLAPAVVRRGDFTLAVGTGGASPGLAARVRRDLEEHYGSEYESLVAILGGVRRLVPRDARRGEVIAALLDSPLLDLVRRRDAGAVDRLLARVVGEGCTLAGLGLALEARG